MLFIFEPLSDEVVLYRKRLAYAGPRENLQHVFCRFGRNGFTGPAAGNDQLQAVNGEALAFSREIGRNCNYACENCNEPQWEHSR